MSKKWRTIPFEDCIERVTYTPKIQRSAFLESGTFPIVSQEERLINGYWNNSSDVFYISKPIVIFGDHTKTLKYVDFDFVLGADGVKILQVRDFLLPRFFFYQLHTANLQTLGYARHYRLLKELRISYPPIPEQQRIVAKLDEAFAAIAKVKENAEKNVSNARTIFESELNAIFTKKGEGWEEKYLEDVATEFGRGRSRHRPRNAPHLYGGKYPFVQTGDIRNAEHLLTDYSQTYSDAGLAQSKLWPKGTVCITIAANIAETAILDFDGCFPDSVIGVVPSPDQADSGFVEYLLQFSKIQLQARGKGSAQDNINMGTFENQLFPFPSVAEQEHIARSLDDIRYQVKELRSNYERKLTALDALRHSMLRHAFTGQL